MIINIFLSVIALLLMALSIFVCSVAVLAKFNTDSSRLYENADNQSAVKVSINLMRRKRRLRYEKAAMLALVVIFYAIIIFKIFT